MSRKIRLLAIGSTVAVMMAGGLVYANATSSDGDQYCRTKAGYIRLSTTGECRRSEVPVDLPTASDYNALEGKISDLPTWSDYRQLVALSESQQSAISALKETNSKLVADVTNFRATQSELIDDVTGLRKRLPTLSEHEGVLTLAQVNLSERDFRGKDFSGANLTRAFLGGINFSGANLSGANLSGAWLACLNWCATFAGANLSGANLSGANLWGANFSGANLTGVISSGIIGIPASLPDGWSLVDGKLVYTQP